MLNKLLELSLAKGIFSGIKFPFHEEPISHFQYADDTILFLDNSEHTIRGIKKVLLLFQVISGLSINFDKISMYHATNDNESLDQGI